MKYLRILLVLTAVVCGLAGCGVGRYLETKSSPVNGSLVVGYLDTKKASCDLQWMNFKPKSLLPNNSRFGFRIDKGAFYKEGVLAGFYEFENFGGQSTEFWDHLNGVHYKFKFPDPNVKFVIEEPGKIYFVGSYQVSTQVNALGESTKITAVNSPGELEVLKMILPDTKGSEWEARIKDRISQLSSGKTE